MNEQKELTASMDAVPEELSVRPGAVSQVPQRVVVELSPEQKKFNAAMNMARTLARSQIVPSAFRDKPDDVFAAIQMGAELGFQPMQSLNAISMIQGNATLKGQTMLSLVRAKVPRSIIKITKEGDVISCYAARSEEDAKNGLGYTAEWSKEKAVKAKFAVKWDKDLKKFVLKDNWENQPETMSRWRAVSEALRVIFPDILMGLYTPEEIEDTYQERPENNEHRRSANEATEVFSKPIDVEVVK